MWIEKVQEGKNMGQKAYGDRWRRGLKSYRYRGVSERCLPFRRCFIAVDKPQVVPPFVCVRERTQLGGAYNEESLTLISIPP